MRKMTLSLLPCLSLLTISTAFLPTQGNTPPLSLTLALLGFCCVFSLIIGVIVLGFVMRRGNQETKKQD
jgi:hypothetical protein